MPTIDSMHECVADAYPNRLTILKLSGMYFLACKNGYSCQVHGLQSAHEGMHNGIRTRFAHLFRFDKMQLVQSSAREGRLTSYRCATGLYMHNLPSCSEPYLPLNTQGGSL